MLKVSNHLSKSLNRSLNFFRFLDSFSSLLSSSSFSLLLNRTFKHSIFLHKITSIQMHLLSTAAHIKPSKFPLTLSTAKTLPAAVLIKFIPGQYHTIYIHNTNTKLYLQKLLDLSYQILCISNYFFTFFASKSLLCIF